MPRCLGIGCEVPLHVSVHLQKPDGVQQPANVISLSWRRRKGGSRDLQTMDIVLIIVERYDPSLR